MREPDPGRAVVVSRGGQRAAVGAEPALGFAALLGDVEEMAFSCGVCTVSDVLQRWSVSRDPAGVVNTDGE